MLAPDGSATRRAPPRQPLNPSKTKSKNRIRRRQTIVRQDTIGDLRPRLVDSLQVPEKLGMRDHLSELTSRPEQDRRTPETNRPSGS